MRFIQYILLSLFPKNKKIPHSFECGILIYNLKQILFHQFADEEFAAIDIF